MKLTTTLPLGLALIAQAIALPPFPMIRLPNTFFGLMALRSATPIHFGAVNANGSELWIGKDPSTYCPGQQGLNCSGVTTSQTTYSLSNGILSLGVQVSGGQLIYIESCGKVSYTHARDSSSLPFGATVRGWSIEKGSTFDQLNHVNGTFFCPPEELPGAWKLYVGVTDSLDQNCLFATLVAAGNDTRVNAYEYI